MTDLLQTARVFEVSSRLSDASAAMADLAKGNEPSDRDRETFRWTGRLLEQVDWESGIAQEPGAEGALSVEATTTRPTFYASIVQMAPELTDAGMKSEQDVYELLKELYGILISEGKKAEDVPQQHVQLGASFLRTLSNSLLVRLSNNGLPQPHTTLTLSGMAWH
jgi:hypothetical protein